MPKQFDTGQGFKYIDGVTPLKTSEIIFTASLPALGKSIHLTRGSWYGHILQRHLKEMQGRQDLIKQALESTTDARQLKRFYYEDAGTFFFDYKCPHFKPAHEYLRVVVMDGYQPIVKSAYPVFEEAKKWTVRYV